MLGASDFAKRLGDRTHTPRAHEIFISQFPGNTQSVQNMSLGGLAAGTSFFDGMNRSRRDAGSFCEVILGPSKGLSGCADAIHEERSQGIGGWIGRARIALLCRSGAGEFSQLLDSLGAFDFSPQASPRTGFTPQATVCWATRSEPAVEATDLQPTGLGGSGSRSDAGGRPSGVRGLSLSGAIRGENSPIEGPPERTPVRSGPKRPVALAAGLPLLVRRSVSRL